MDLLRSGSPLNEPLLIVETDDFTLTVTGRAYHEQYEKMKVYYGINNDEMLLSWRGKRIRRLIVQHEALSPLQNEWWTRPLFFEQATYQLTVVPKNDRILAYRQKQDRFVQRIQQVQIEDRSILVGEMTFRRELGSFSFSIWDEKADEMLLNMDIEIFPTKVPYHSMYMLLLQETNDLIEGLPYHPESGSYIGVRPAPKGKSSSLVHFSYLLIQMLEGFLEQVDWIEQHAHATLATQYRPTKRVTALDMTSYARSYIRKHPKVLEKGQEHPVPQKGLKRSQELVPNSPENQAIKGMLQRLESKIAELDDLLDEPSVPHFFTKTMNHHLATLRPLVQERLQRSFWKGVQSSPIIPASNQMRMGRGYKEAYRLFLHMNGQLVMERSAYQLAVRPLYQLYEYWTFLKLCEILNKHFQRVQKAPHAYMVLPTGSRQYFRNQELEITVVFQPTLETPTSVQRPDILVEWTRNEGTRSFIFDAKYRADVNETVSTPLVDDIYTMHRYRDAYREKDGRRKALGACVLFPGLSHEEYQHTQFYQSLETVKIGGLPFLPTHTLMVETFLLHLLQQ